MWILSQLTFRIFAIFFLTIMLFVTFVLVLPKLDARNLTYLSDEEQSQGQAIAKNIEQELNQFESNDFRWWLRFITAMDNNSSPEKHLFAINPDGQTISSFKPEPSIVRDFTSITNNSNFPAKKIYDNREYTGPFMIKYKDADYRLYFIQSTKSFQSQFTSLLFDHPFFLLLIVMVISSPFLLWFSWSLTKPVRKLKYAADQVACGDLTELPELESSTIEFRAVGISFNHMLRELNRMMSIQQRLLSDISHELRTPLTRLKLATALLRRKQGGGSEINRIEDEANKLGDMIEDLLQLARQQHENNSIMEKLPLNQLWEEVIDNAIFEAEQLEKNIEINDKPANYFLWGNSAMLDSALENIIRNAFKYSNERIVINFKIKDKNLIVSVDDDGIGVPDDELEQIFRPFYRIGEARDRESGGAGLGLAIVKNTMSHHKGEIIAVRSQLGGLRIEIHLPFAK